MNTLTQTDPKVNEAKSPPSWGGKVTLPLDSGTNIFDSMIVIGDDNGAICPVCGDIKWNRSELGAWNEAVDCIMRHREHANRCPDDIPFMGEPVAVDDSHDTASDIYGAW